MTVAELIAILSEMPGDAPVLVANPEYGGYTRDPIVSVDVDGDVVIGA